MKCGPLAWCCVIQLAVGSTMVTTAGAAAAVLLTLLVLAAWIQPFVDGFVSQRLEKFHYITVEETDQEGFSPEENDKSYWRTKAIDAVHKKLQERTIKGVAKNIIFFLGDGMSVPTITASRIYLGQLNGKSGENSRLSFEELPYTGVSKTYCVNKQVADSACSSTAYLGGVKGNYGTIGVTSSIIRGNCTGMLDAENRVDTLLKWAQDAGKVTGVVTTTRITHASPAGNYAHTAERDYESDADVLQKNANPDECVDIARQLVQSEPGKSIKVLLGGGRSKFIPHNAIDEEGQQGERHDGEDLIEQWKLDKLKRNAYPRYVWNREQLLHIDPAKTDYLLGLFEGDHMLYHNEANQTTEPTLEEMTRVALAILQKEKLGYYLFVEGGKIDMAHHKNWARRAFDETVEFHKAIKAAMELTNMEDTLIVVTADHAHTMSFSGYPRRGDDILGSILISEMDNLPYSTISYANGPSAEVNYTGHRHNISNDHLDADDYQYPSLVKLKDETHGGDDVLVYARGPWAHLFTGNYEQNVIPVIISHAAMLGPMHEIKTTSSSYRILPYNLFIFIVILISCVKHLK